jgi:tetratricopeptide (TPR) repeat protein
MEASPAIVHGADWPAAGRYVQWKLDSMLPQWRLEAMLLETAGLADRPPRKVMLRGSPWGAVQRRLRKAEGLDAAVPPSMKLPRMLDEPFLSWQALLAGGELPYYPPDDAPGLYVTGPAWRKRLADALAAGRGDHWLAWLHLGVMAFREGDLPAAENAWRTSLSREPSAWAYRNLAVLARQQDHAEEAIELYLKASQLKPGLTELQIECGRALLEARRLDELSAWLATLPESVLRAARMRLLTAWAAYHRGELDAAEATLDRVELTDLREGETTLTDLWFAIQTKRQAAAEGVPADDALQQRIRQTLRPPKHLDYRMGGQ